ncbi:MAG TPA: hypothetical protein RMH85_07440 [Polyangiaceae bacterium LLY-WYZ-15_(1-7)]|nr:hypothetical protein [Myxococcales bacterium]MAT28366.1 hypothetical protein [Sandaracinus sp.]HJK91329.1 hypothetical protein [Polyangiaceae bacterium LLY-WYZ-15_(1-7)]MBJ73086.1 hypothetical protein [Sandaracinus sp.]HJL04062.1 hypothetical protein [Polyangiaceae bacterium LLY-WYZ-15_(1-7)]
MLDDDDDAHLFRPPEPTPAGTRRFAHYAFAVAAALFVALTWMGLPLHTEVAPAGIVSFELARTPGQAIAIVQSWDEAARARAAIHLSVDYAFLLAYAAWLWAALRGLALRFEARGEAGARGARWSRRLAASMWLAAGLDAVENAALGIILAGGFDPEDPEGLLSIDASWPALAFTCAVFKFALVALALGVLIWGAVKVPVPPDDERA